MAQYCYKDIFRNCNLQTGISQETVHIAPMAQYCYKDIFRNCNLQTSGAGPLGRDTFKISRPGTLASVTTISALLCIFM